LAQILHCFLYNSVNRYRAVFFFSYRYVIFLGHHKHVFVLHIFLTVQEINYLLVVDLQKRSAHVKSRLSFLLLNFWKNLFDNSWDHSFIVAIHRSCIGSHRISFAAYIWMIVYFQFGHKLGLLHYIPRSILRLDLWCTTDKLLLGRSFTWRLYQTYSSYLSQLWSNF